MTILAQVSLADYDGLSFSAGADYSFISAVLISGFDDVSFTPVLSLNHDLFQGTTLTITAQAPIDRALIYCDDRHGELGPHSYYFYSSAKVRVRF